VSTPETDGETMKSYCRDHGFDYQLELKLETEDRRYWLCTRCVGQGFARWHEGVALVENVKPNEAGEHEMTPYGANDVKTLQRVDYSMLLMAQLDRLLEGPQSPETDKEILEVRKEINSFLGLPPPE